MPRGRRLPGCRPPRLARSRLAVEIVVVEIVVIEIVVVEIVVIRCDRLDLEVVGQRRDRLDLVEPQSDVDIDRQILAEHHPDRPAADHLRDLDVADTVSELQGERVATSGSALQALSQLLALPQ